MVQRHQLNEDNKGKIQDIVRTMFDITTIIGYLITPVTALIGWLAGTRSRRNRAIQELLETIRKLSEQNAEYNESIVQLQGEVIEVRKENAQLKANQEIMIKKMDEYERENRNLKELLTKKS